MSVVGIEEDLNKFEKFVAPKILLDAELAIDGSDATSSSIFLWDWRTV
jgi:hypothetical protein